MTLNLDLIKQNIIAQIHKHTLFEHTYHPYFAKLTLRLDFKAPYPELCQTTMTMGWEK